MSNGSNRQGDANEIKITPAMIDAGVDALLDSCPHAYAALSEDCMTAVYLVEKVIRASFQDQKVLRFCGRTTKLSSCAHGSHAE